jgi:iron complex transport system ATP-binding protein
MVTLAAERLSVALGKRTVVDDVSASFRSGELVGVLGPNGAGKSTLARALLGLLPLAAGSVTLDDADISRLSRADLARRIAYLPQGQVLHWPLSVARLVALGRLPWHAAMGRPTEADDAAVADAMVRADVAHLADRVATQLSGGERARALLARALAVGAPVLIADEPLAALDPGHQFDVMDVLRAETTGGRLVILLMHDLALAARYCDRILLLQNGRVVADGPPEAVLTAAILRDVYGIDARIEALDPLVVTPTGRARM